VCGGATATHPSHDAGAMVQGIDVRVPRTALLRVDRHRRVIAAATNTGCAPRLGDDVYFVSPTGDLAPAPPSAILGHRWRGDFTVSGVFVAQKPPQQR